MREVIVISRSENGFRPDTQYYKNQDVNNIVTKVACSTSTDKPVQTAFNSVTSFRGK